MTNGVGSTAICRNPACSEPVPSTRHGRPRIYCSDACRKAYYRISPARRVSPDAERHDRYVQQILDELWQRIDRLRDLAHADRTGLTGADSPRSQALALLKGSAEACKDLQDLDAAIVQQARDRGVKVADIAAARNISADKVSRDWPADSIDRRMNQRQQRRSVVHRPAGSPDVVNEPLHLPGRYLPGEGLGPGLSGYGRDATEGPPPMGGTCPYAAARPARRPRRACASLTGPAVCRGCRNVCTSLTPDMRESRHEGAVSADRAVRQGHARRG
ncbi:hypothetical protein [Streptomyces sp. NPDC001678]|uniref:hypothetical protein n=1 Tax=Streptomyces sp. NPDC001678 TaxID=3364599 RepID=UPI0036C77BDC